MDWEVIDFSASDWDGALFLIPFSPKLQQVFGKCVDEVLPGDVILFEEENFFALGDFYWERIFLDLVYLPQTNVVVKDHVLEDDVVRVGAEDIACESLGVGVARRVQIWGTLQRELHEGFLHLESGTMLIVKKVYRLTVNFTMLFSTSLKFMRRKILVAMTAVPLPCSFISRPYWKAKASRMMVMISQRISSP